MVGGGQVENCHVLPVCCLASADLHLSSDELFCLRGVIWTTGKNTWHLIQQQSLNHSTKVCVITEYNYHITWKTLYRRQTRGIRQ